MTGTARHSVHPRPRWWRLIMGAVLGAALVVVAGCSVDPPDRSRQAEQLTQEIRTLPAVVSATNDVADSFAQGVVYFELHAQLADGFTGDQLATITSTYLHQLRAVDYSGYRTEFVAHLGASTLAIDGGRAPIDNAEQVIRQARDWVALLRKFPGSTVTLGATVTHPSGTAAGADQGHPSAGRIDLPDVAAYPEVAAAFSTLAATVPELARGDWTVEAGNQHPAEITTSRRWPDDAELGVWNTLNADQSIPHVDTMIINAARTGPMWVAETTPSRDPDVALKLAHDHLPTVARLPAPVLYTANDAWSAHLDYAARATQPAAITTGGCTRRTYPPMPAEQTLIDTYETCHR